jgi:hypothetical protein
LARTVKNALLKSLRDSLPAPHLLGAKNAWHAACAANIRKCTAWPKGLAYIGKTTPAFKKGRIFTVQGVLAAAPVKNVLLACVRLIRV